MTGASALTELGELLGGDPGPCTVTPLQHNADNAVTAGIWRYAGAGWSVVHKLVTAAGSGHSHWVTSRDPQHWNYWLREPLAYRSGLPATAYQGCGIAAPRLLRACDRADGGVALWLEDVVGTPGEAWDVATVADFARRLGHAQGAYAGGRPMPDPPWLSRRWLRQYVDSKPVDGSLLHEDAAWQPIPAYDGLRAGLTRLWHERAALLAAVESVPQTLCHLDVWPKNLVARGGERVMIDWAFVGVGALGEDAGNLVPDCVFDGFLPTSALGGLADSVWTGYLAGLREAGWRGDERRARLGFTAGGAVKYAWLAEQSLRRVRDGDLASYGGYSTIAPTDLLATYAAVFRLLLGWADEARALSAELGS